VPYFIGDPGRAITNGRELRSCLGVVFNSKLGHIANLCSKCRVCMQPLLKLKTWPRACPVSLSLSMGRLRVNPVKTFRVIFALFLKLYQVDCNGKKSN
jgi:hypothetical protein